MARLALIALALCAAIPLASAVDAVVNELKQLRTKEANAIADAIPVLTGQYDYQPEDIRAAHERCKEKHGNALLPCIVNALHVEKMLHDHLYDICVFEYIKQTAVECADKCFDRYNVECLQCAGAGMPQLIQCLTERPEAYAEKKK